MRPLEETITDTSRLKAADIRLQFAERENMRLQRLVDARNKPVLEELKSLRDQLEEANTKLAAAEARPVKRTRKAPSDITRTTDSLIELCSIHLTEMAERLQDAGLDTLPSEHLRYLGGLTDPLPAAQETFIACRTPAPVDQPAPTKRRRTRKAPTPD